MASHHVLILGGHGNIAQKLTPLLLRRSWTVTSVIRKQEQVPTIEKLGAGLPGKLNVLVQSIEDVASQQQAQDILTKVKPDYIAWSAGTSSLAKKNVFSHRPPSRLCSYFQLTSQHTHPHTP